MTAKKAVKKTAKSSTKGSTKGNTKSGLLAQVKNLQEQVSNLESASRENQRLLKNNQALQNAVADEQERSAKIINELQIEMFMNHLFNTVADATVKAITDLKSQIAELEQDNHHKQIQIDALHDKVLAEKNKFGSLVFQGMFNSFHPPSEPVRKWARG